jgi:hypothetical protein
MQKKTAGQAWLPPVIIARVRTVLKGAATKKRTNTNYCMPGKRSMVGVRRDDGTTTIISRMTMSLTSIIDMMGRRDTMILSTVAVGDRAIMLPVVRVMMALESSLVQRSHPHRMDMEVQ